MATRGNRRGVTETVTVRLTASMRYLVDLAGRRQRRSTSNFIECAVAGATEAVELTRRDGTTVRLVGADLWDVDPEARFRKLATQFPDLLSYEEQKRWAAIRGGR